MALLRGVEIPCRLHGSEVSKYFQRGATSWLISVLAPERIVHTWVEVLYMGNWVALEDVIADDCYIRAIKDKHKNVSGHFAKYAVAVPNLESLNLNGVYDTPDIFLSRIPKHGVN